MWICNTTTRNATFEEAVFQGQVEGLLIASIDAGFAATGVNVGAQLIGAGIFGGAAIAISRLVDTTSDEALPFGFDAAVDTLCFAGAIGAGVVGAHWVA